MKDPSVCLLPNSFEALKARITRAMEQMEEGMLSRIWTELDYR